MDDDDGAARFEAVYRETFDQIAAYAARRCDSPQDAADVVAETYAIAWRRVADLPPGQEAKLWLYGVARKVLADHRRSTARQRLSSVELDAELADLYGDHSGSSVELNVIGAVFRGLSDDDRELLSLVAWEGLGRDEIAAMLGLSRNAVRIRLYRARRRFSRALDEAGVLFTTASRMIPAGRSS
ncbi:RNA polymerase sigma factor [Nonomuraea spiralis]|uniref:RNA polymerase sigma factor n=1 Tax=Nonomuraea TaxID=83681 RepID=UPI000F79D46F|nr:RNA polymerase sigma factor [Nonomuraea sp. WAC 01424]RSN04790.1 RNA polymerase subunit sigma-24 [Nonomuraea sp. WAC 01424]